MNAAVKALLLIILGTGGLFAYGYWYAKEHPIPSGDIPVTLSLLILNHNGQPVNAQVMIFNMSATSPSLIYRVGLYASSSFQTLNCTFWPGEDIRIDVENPDDINQAAMVTLTVSGISMQETITLAG